ncbi:MAG: (2Fe-2S)-binding protein [Burkholderiales bacterium]|nr:(2Fe-2S)-binding protein [Burkholderiales bacterium]
MPKVIIHRNGVVHTGEVKENSNLVVRAGIRQFPYPNLSYGCGMGKCGKCTSRVIAGGEALPPPNWKEEKVLGAKLAEGYRLTCQLWINHDIELEQDWTPATAARGAIPGLQRQTS